jgi:hypothetical protein
VAKLDKLNSNLEKAEQRAKRAAEKMEKDLVIKPTFEDSLMKMKIAQLQTLLKLENASGTASSGTKISFTEGGSEKAAIISQINTGTTPYLSFENNGSERMRITSTGEVLVGGTAELSSFSGGLSLQRTNQAPNFNLYRNDTSVSSGNVLGSIGFWGNDTTSNTPTTLAFINGTASGDHAAGDNPTDLTFGTTADGSATVTERMRIDNSGNVLVGITSARANAGDVQVSKGISFPATQSAQSDANTLDDYEQGTFNAVISDGTNNATMSVTQCSYVKIGRQVSITGYISTSSLGSVSGALRITGLPFANTAGNNFQSSVSIGFGGSLAITAGNAVSGYIGGGASFITLTVWSAAGGTSNLTNSQWSGSGGGIILASTYFAAD